MKFSSQMTFLAVLDWLEDYARLSPASLALHFSKTLRKKVTRELAAATRLSYHNLAKQNNLSFDALFHRVGMVAAESDVKCLKTPLMLVTAANDEETLNKVLDGSSDQMLLLINVLERNLNVITETSGESIVHALTTHLRDAEAFIHSERELFLKPSGAV